MWLAGVTRLYVSSSIPGNSEVKEYIVYTLLWLTCVDGATGLGVSSFIPGKTKVKKYIVYTLYFG